MNLTEQLARLAEIAPDVCEPVRFSDATVYRIGEYDFWEDSFGRFTASLKTITSIFAKGDPALAWLTDALEMVVVSRGWFYEMSFWSYGNKPRYRVRIASANVAVVDESTKAGALLAALIEALV